jgi:SpoIIAA-like
MLRITEDEAHGCFVLEPSGALSRRDLDALTERFDAYVNARDRIPNLVVRAVSFPTWTDFAALVKHLRFIREHHRLVRKVALVSDARALDLAPKIAGHFVSADIRHFPAAGLDAALAWVAEAERPKVTVIDGLPDDTIGISVEGAIEARDYDTTIGPLIEAKLRDYAHIKLLYQLGPGFASVTPGAVWSDARIGLKHLTGFSRVAVVSDIEWIRHAVRLFAPMIPAEVHVFPDAELPAAKAWLAAQ